VIIKKSVLFSAAYSNCKAALAPEGKANKNKMQGFGCINLSRIYSRANKRAIINFRGGNISLALLIYCRNQLFKLKTNYYEKVI
jgi:hypothetical protein